MPSSALHSQGMEALALSYHSIHNSVLALLAPQRLPRARLGGGQGGLAVFTQPQNGSSKSLEDDDENPSLWLHSLPPFRERGVDVLPACSAAPLEGRSAGRVARAKLSCWPLAVACLGFL